MLGFEAMSADIDILKRVRDRNPTSRLSGDWQGDDTGHWRGVTCSDDGRVKELYGPFHVAEMLTRTSKLRNMHPHEWWIRDCLAIPDPKRKISC